MTSEIAAARAPAHTDTHARRPLPFRLPAVVTPSALAISCLVVLPVLVYGIPGMLGHPVAPGDDLTQSIPLRELVGSDLRAGHLPIFDPYLWSGTPLLAGWNAGAAYPLTWIFMFLPANAAWTVNVAAVPLVAGLGTFAFLRACRLGVVASFLGALTFAFGGAMSAQVQHIGLIVGMSWIPVALLAVLRLSAPGPRALGARLGWTVVLAVSIGLVLLAGEPRAVANAAVVVALFALWRLARTRGAWSFATVATGAALGAGLGAVQLLPGLAAVATSQRAAVTTFLYSAGSLSPRWLLLLGVPDLLGGSGSLGQPHFFASYNLVEVTCYVGILPLVGAFALLTRLRWRPLPEWAVWYGIGAVGVLLALATHTPLWHLLVRLPLFGGQRLQSRSIMVTDLALAVLFAYWADGWLRARRVPAAEIAMGALAALCVACVVIVALAWRVPLLEWMGVPATTAAAQGSLGPWLVPFLLLALAAVALVAAGGRLPHRARAWAVIAFTTVDLVVFTVSAVVSVGTAAPVVATTQARAATPVSPSTAVRRGAARSARSNHGAEPIGTLHLPGRFAVYDPTLLDGQQLRVLGPPDANAADRTYSVEGYGSIADGHYAAATGTHEVSGGGQDVFAPAAAADGVFDELDTTTVLALSTYFALPAGTATPRAATGTGKRTARGGGRATWYLGTPVVVSAAQLRASAGRAGPRTAMRVGLMEPSGDVAWASGIARTGSGTTGSGGTPTWRATWAHPVRAVALVAETTSASSLGTPTVTVSGGMREKLDGALQRDVAWPHWRYAGDDGEFAMFRDTRAKAALTLRALHGRNLGGATVHRRSGPPLDPASATVSSPHGVEVVRADAAVPGWTAQWQPAGSARASPLRVRRTGVVQVVTVPSGTGVVSWRYLGPEVGLGEALSLAALAATVLLVLGASWCALVERRSTRRGPEPAP